MFQAESGSRFQNAGADRPDDRKDAAEELDDIVEFLEEVVIEEPGSRSRALPPPLPPEALRASAR